MIKMLGLLKEDMSKAQNEWAWYGYQVSMRILEVTLCTLLAVIATTPLRSEAPGLGGHGLEASPAFEPEETTCLCCCKRKDQRSKKGNTCWSCLFGDSNPPREFEDEIYSEICSNNHSVRQVLGNNDNGYGNGTIMALGTLNHTATLIQQPNNHHHHQTMLAMGSR